MTDEACERRQLSCVAIDRFNKHLNCTFDLREIIRLGQQAYEDEQMGQESALERTVFGPNQLTSFCDFVALMLMLGIAVRHDELLAEALELVNSKTECDDWCVRQQFVAWSDADEFDAIDPREREEPFASAVDFMPVLDSLAPFEHTPMSPFTTACRFGRVDLVKQWMRDEAPLSDGLTLAARGDHVEVVDAILQRVGANGQVWRLMHVAAEANAIRVVDYLLSRTADDKPIVDHELESLLWPVIQNCTVDVATRVLDEAEIAGALGDRAAERALMAAKKLDMATMLFARFQFDIATIAYVLKYSYRNEELFDFLFDRFVAWSGDASAFDDALAVGITGLVDAYPASFKYLPRLLKLQLRVPNARCLGVYPWYVVFSAGAVDLAALLLCDDRITVMWSVCRDQISREQCRVVVNVLEHERFVREESRLSGMVNEFPGTPDNRGRVARMYLTDVCIALRPMRLPSLVLDEIVSHLPAMGALTTQERMSNTIVKINERQ